jgi:outer membrane lipoprotein-sorting protein
MSNRRWRRWVPAVAAPAVIAAGVVVSGAQADAPANLPAKTPEQIIALAAGNTVEALSGTVQQTSDLGLPKLPSDQQSGGQGQAGAANLLELLTGSHTARVYVDGPQKARVQVLDQLAERDMVRNGSSVWVYDSARNEATHLRLPAGAAEHHAGKAGDRGLSGQALTPDAVAQRFLAMVGPSTQVTSGSSAKVAGRSAYELVLTPKPGTTKSDTLIREVSIDVDSATGLPLAVRVQARGQAKPAFSVAYTDLTLKAPDASVFKFTPPAGAKVTERTLPADHGKADRRASGGMLPAQNRPQVVGDGWDAVMVAQAGVSPSMLTSNPLFAQMTKPVTGGRLLHTSLINVLIKDDGTVLAGSVPVQRLQAVAQDR